MNQDRSRMLIEGRAYVRLIEAADVLLAGEGDDAERTLLHKMRQTYTSKLRELIGKLPPEATAEILAASDKIIGPVGDVSRN
jgi:hypothetical protein